MGCCPPCHAMPCHALQLPTWTADETTVVCKLIFVSTMAATRRRPEKGHVKGRQGQHRNALLAALLLQAGIASPSYLYQAGASWRRTIKHGDGWCAQHPGGVLQRQDARADGIRVNPNAMSHASAASNCHGPSQGQCILGHWRQLQPDSTASKQQAACETGRDAAAGGGLTMSR